jgi:tRNA(Ile)-lysidine synthase
MTAIETALYEFLKKHYHLQQPVLLGLSGGPDSLLLFHLLVKFIQPLSLRLGIAHIDHGWRKESGLEADHLEKIAAQYHLPFHLKRINPLGIKGNLEAGCRQVRLQFFKDLCHRHGYQAVILGHHAGDFIETVFKRILEGVSLPYLCGLQEVTRIQDLCLWRPFLSFPKKQILEAIQEYHLSPFEDPTNKDPKFLRGRFRTRIFPMLSLEFGKEIDKSLERIGNEAKALKEYLEFNLKEELENIQISSFGHHLDFTARSALHPYEIQFLVKKFCEMGNFYLSKNFLDKAVHLLQCNAADKEILMGSHKLYIDRGHLFLILREPSLPKERVEIHKGKFYYGSWQIDVEPVENMQTHGITNWQEAWKGQCEVVIPEDQSKYYLGPVELTSNYPGGSPISKWWTNAKVPALLRHFFPVIRDEKGVCAEFLTGRKNQKQKEASKGLKIRLKIKPNEVTVK